MSAVDRCLVRPRRTQSQQSALCLGSTGVLAGTAVGTHHAMAGYDDGQGVDPARRSDRTRGLRVTGGGRHRRVALRRAVADVPEMGQHVQSEAMGEAQIEGQVETAPPTREVLIELTGHLVEATRSA